MVQLISLFQASSSPLVSPVITQPVSTFPAGEPCPYSSPTSSLFPSATSSIQVHPGATLSSLFGRGKSCWFGSPPKILQQVPTSTGPEAAVALVPALVPGTLLYQSNLFTVYFSMSSTILAFNLHICWDSIGCSLCSSEDWLGVPPVCRGSGLHSHLPHHHHPAKSYLFSLELNWIMEKILT